MKGEGKNLNTVYFTLLREPSSQWLSGFLCFKVQQKLKIKQENDSADVEYFINNYKAYYKNTTPTWDKQLRSLEIPTKRFENMTLIEFERLEKDSDLVMILKYFDEFLVLLKNLICWNFNDIVYARQRGRPSNVTLTPKQKEATLNMNAFDLRHYKLANASPWKRINSLGKKFEKDLETFRSRLTKTHKE